MPCSPLKEKYLTPFKFWTNIRFLLVLSEHLSGGEAHDAAPHGREHPHLEAGEGDDGGPEARGHKQGPGNGNLV